MSRVITKHKFTPDEDRALIAHVATFGQNWLKIASMMPGRNCRQVRERYLMFLSPSIRQDQWTPDEDHLLLRFFAANGPKWKKISHSIDGRSEVDVKNRYLLLMRREKKKQLNSLLSRRKHITPVSHTTDPDSQERVITPPDEPLQSLNGDINFEIDPTWEFEFSSWEHDSTSSFDPFKHEY